jgi:hypothetical protein
MDCKGSSTCLLIILDEEKPKIHVSNIGDSGFALYRYFILFKSITIFIYFILNIRPDMKNK